MGHRTLAPFRSCRNGVLLGVLLVGSASLIAGSLEPRGSAADERGRNQLAPSSKDYEGFALLQRVFFKPLPEKMPGASGDTPQMAALGRRLYFERGISLTKSQSCNDCHRLDDPKMAGTDRLPVPKGATGVFGRRNAPTVLNAGFQIVQFWDGRAADLEEQAKGPVLNPVEMAMCSPADVENRLREKAGYLREFQTAFPDSPHPLNYDNAVRAIAAFERTLVAPARFDRYLKGQRDALTPAEEAGLHRFVQSGCVACHSSHPVGGRMFQTLGIYRPYKNPKDQGRYEITHQEEDRFVFKVPMLRNVTLTEPYFHDGQVADLPEAVRLMAQLQVDVDLSAPEIGEIVRFLGALESERPPTIADPAASSPVR